MILIPDQQDVIFKCLLLSCTLLYHFKLCQSKAKKTPQRQQTLLGMLNRKRKLSEEGTSNEGSAQLTVDSDVDVSDTEDTRAQ